MGDKKPLTNTTLHTGHRLVTYDRGRARLYTGAEAEAFAELAEAEAVIMLQNEQIIDLLEKLVQQGVRPPFA
jgi:hypothetical protein